ncbi:MAG: hypothetical protein IJ668_08910 [Selenomonadaceae bacterium]|nr:hypothetical protein [Selenomonadaceae bacterium]
MWYKNGSSLTKFDGDSTVRNGVFINTANNVLLDELSVENVINYGDNVTIDVDEGTAVTLNGSSQVIRYGYSYQMALSNISGLGDDDTIYVPNGFNTALYSDDIDVKGKRLNFSDGKTVTSILINDESNVPAGGTGIDYVINKNSDMVYANGSTVINQAENANIRGFGDNDSIINNRDNVSIGSGAGNDTIENSFGNNIIINGGVDDDLILFMGSGVIEYADGDGNDTVLGFNSGETIRILYGTIDSGYNEGFDTVLKIGDGSIRLKNAAGESITVQDSLGNVTSTVCGNVLVGTDQADTLESTIDNAIVKPLSGDDVVSLKGAKQIVDYEGGNDTVYGLDADDTVRIGEWIFESPEMIGNDLRLTVIEDYAGEDGGSLTLKDIANKKITMVNTGGDILYVMPGGATVANGSGITGVENYVDNALVSLGGDVSRFYSSYTSNVTVNAGGGDNEIRVGGDIYAEDGEELHSRNVNVKAGEGNDYIVFQGVRKVSIDAGDDGSYISHGWQDSAIIEDITIKGGSGGDQINGTFVNANIDAGDGDNAIGEMNTWNLTLKAGSGNDEIYLNGTDISVDAGDGNNIIGISNNEDITKNVTVKSGSGKDTIDAGGVNVVINSGSGDDSITNIRYDTSINAGEGDDYISGYLDRSTINAGKGNDTVRMSGAGGWLYQYANGDGNDTIDIGSSDSAVGIIHVTSGNVSSVVLDGSNAVINVGSGSIVLNGFTNFNVPLAIKDSSGNVALWYKDGDALTKFDGDSTIRNDTFINVANNAAIDQPVIVNYGSKNSINLVESDELYQPTVEVMIKTDLTTFVDGKEVNFYVTQNVPGQLLTNYGDDATINVGSTSYITLNGARQVINVDRSFSYVYGLGADDTVYSDYRDWLEEAMTQKVSGNNIEFDYLTLYDAVGKKLNFASGDSVTSMLFANDWYAAGGKDIDYVINLNSLTVTANGSTVINKGAESRVIGWSDDDAIINLSAGSKTSIHTGDGNDTVYGFGSGDTLNIIYGSISGGHTEGNDTVLEIGDGSIRLKNTAGNSITVRDANGSVTSNAYANIIEGTDEADTLASTITGVIFKPYEGDDIVSLNGSYQIVEYLSGSDTIYGYREGDIIRLENYWGFDSFEKSGNDMVIANVETEESLTFKNVGNKKIMMLSSDGKTRYIMSDATVDNDSEVSTVENYIDGVNVSLDTGVSQFYNKGDNVTVSAAGEIEFENANGNNVLFRSGAGSDTIDLSSADGVTIDAGDGDNNFNLNGLSNGVVSAGSGNDFIDGEAVSNVSINLGDGNNEIMVSSEQDPFINVTIKSGSDDDRIDDKFINSNIDLGDGNNEVYDLMGENITLKTGAGNDTIRTSNLSILASSINASAGDDTIYIEHNTMYIDPNDVFRFTTVVGGKGNDTFQAYNNSNWIYQYANGDGDDEIIYSRSSFDGLIQLTDGSISDVSLEGSSFVIKVGSGSLTVSRNYNNSLFVKNAQGDFSAWYVDNIDDKALSLANTSYFVDYQLFNGINNYGSNVVINSDAEGAADFIFNYGSNVTVNGGAGNDTVVLAGAEQVVYYAEGDGNDTIFGVSSSDTIRVDGAFSTVESGDDLNVNVGDGSMKFVGGAGVGFRVIDAAFVPAADSLTAGIEYDPKKPSKLIVKDPFSGIVNAADFSDKITLIDATSSNRMVVLKAGAKSTVIEAGKGESTLIGGGKDDKLYGGDGVNTFVYTVGEGKDAVYDYEAKDIISIAGATRDKLIFTDKKDAVIINVDGDKKSQLTINKVVTTDALTIDMGGETFKYGELPTGVTFDDDKKKTVLKVGSTAEDGVIVDAAEIVSTAKTLDGTGASGSVHLIGNGNKNELKAGKHGSTLYGGKYNVADKLIGGDGADVFVYGTGDGADVITNFDGTEDVVMLNGVTSLKADNLKWSGDKLIVTVGSQKLTLEDPKGQVNFVNDSGTTLYSTGVNFPTGVSYNKGKTAIIVDGTAVDVGTIDLTSTAYVSTVKEINATAYGGEIEMIGGANADVLRAGSGVSTMNGGAGADKLYGGSGSDTFVYDGVGNDVIYQFDGTKDVVMLKGVTTLDPKNINVGANKIVVTVNGGKLTLDDPQGQVNFVNDSGTTLYSVGINFADGIGYNKGKTAITVDGSASDVGTIDLTSSAYVTTVKEINATAYGGELNLIGNANANVIRAGKGNATLNGGYDASKNKATSDKLYGTTTAGSSDVFVWDAFLGGGDQIYNYDAAAGDIISVTGANLTINKKDFKESGKNVVLSAGGGKLTINDVADKPIVVVYGDDTITYGSLDGGLAYVDNNKRLTIGDPFSGTIDADDYNAAVVTLDASAATDEITLIGNKKTKAMVGGSGSTTMIGSTANDNFHAGTGADVIVYAEDDGKDVVYNFDSGTDVIRLSDTTVAVTDFTEKGNDIIISVGKGSITLKNAPRGTYNVEYDGGSVSYTTLPQNTTYNAKKNVLTLTKDFSGALAASDVCVPIKEINGSAATGAINLTAGSTATKLTASKGGSTLTGGDGKDTLIGGNGADLFVTSGGDLIDKYTAGKDKIRITGTLTSGKVSGSNVELTTSEGTTTIKGVVGKEITLEIDGVESAYKFTKANNTLEKALISNGASQLPADAYWFMRTDDAIDELGSLIDGNTTADDTALAPLSQSFDPSSPVTNALTSTLEKARHLKK